MARQSISFSKPNDQWLKSLVESEEYSSKSEIMNDPIRKERGKQNEFLCFGLNSRSQRKD